MRYFSLTCLLYFAVVWHGSSFESDLPFFLSPFVPALVLVALSHSVHGPAALIMAATFGVCLDGLSGGALGTQLIVATILMWVCQGRLAVKIPGNLIGMMIQGFGLSFAWRFLSLSFTSVLLKQAPQFHAVWPEFLLEAFVTGLFTGVLTKVVLLVLGATVTDKYESEFSGNFI